MKGVPCEVVPPTRGTVHFLVIDTSTAFATPDLGVMDIE
jgi:hypothetical protein